jgi:hypothetical protein
LRLPFFDGVLRLREAFEQDAPATLRRNDPLRNISAPLVDNFKAPLFLPAAVQHPSTTFFSSLTRALPSCASDNARQAASSISHADFDR